MATFRNVNMSCALVNDCTGISMPPNPQTWGNPGQYNSISPPFTFVGIYLEGNVPKGPYIVRPGFYQNVAGKWTGPVNNIVSWTILGGIGTEADVAAEGSAVGEETIEFKLGKWSDLGKSDLENTVSGLRKWLDDPENQGKSHEETNEVLKDVEKALNDKEA